MDVETATSEARDLPTKPPAPSAPGSSPQRHLPRGTEFLLDDVLASIVVFFVAIPLCLGIALASGAPLFAGILAGIVGGIVVGAASGSAVSVSGPAAGLTVICAEAIHDIGSYEGFLTAVILAGALQLLFGYLKLGSLGEYCPNSVIKGMLSGIGAVIILKQIPHALGKSTDFVGDESFWQIGDGANSLSAILRALHTYHPTAVVITTISLVLLIVWERAAKGGNKFFKTVPASLAVVVFGILCDQLVSSAWPAYSLGALPGHHVTLPIFSSAGEFFGALSFPHLGSMVHPTVLVAALTIAIIASIESLLSVEASDKLDPYRRITDTNRELRAQGLGNICSGFIGGLPVTAVIVRSSTNLYAGAKTKLSAIFHGTLLLVCALLIPQVLNLIPLACLAAVLILVGYKLVSPKIVRETFHSGPDQFLPFMITLVAILCTDLLTGVLLGLVVGLVFVLKTNHHDAVTLTHEGKDYLMRLNKNISFVNKAELKRELRQVPDGATLLIDGSKAMFLDKDIYDMLADFAEQARHRSIVIDMRNVDRKSVGIFAPAERAEG